MQSLDVDIADATFINAVDGKIVAALGFFDRPAAVSLVDPSTGKTQALQSAGTPPTIPVSRAQPLEWPTTDNEQCFGYLYPPTSETQVGPAAGLPPLIVIAHGGPTAAALPTYNLAMQFWTSRGFAVLDVNYRGSSGFGRSRPLTRLRREQVISASPILSYSPRTPISSSPAISTVSLGPIRMPSALSVTVHRCITRHASRCRFSCCKVWTTKSCRRTRHPRWFARSRRLGVVELVEFAGEGHGFRFGSSIKRAYESELSFYQDVFGLQLDPGS